MTENQIAEATRIAKAYGVKIHYEVPSGRWFAYRAGNFIAAAMDLEGLEKLIAE